LIITAELSLYPLVGEFEDSIINFIKILRSHEDLEVFTHSMSSYVRGESDIVFDAIKKAYNSSTLKLDTVSLVIKIVNRPLPVEEGFMNIS